MRVTIYGLYCGDRCHYVGSADRPAERERQHRRQLPVTAKAIPADWQMRPLSVIKAERRLDAMRAEGYWILKLKSEGHPVSNTSLEGWPKEALTKRGDWWPVIDAWAKSVGLHDGATDVYLTLTEAAAASGKSKQYIAMSARAGRIKGAVQVQGRWSIPASFALGSESLYADRVAATERALKLVAKGWTAYAAAKKEGIALSTIYRALKRQKEQKQ